MFSTVIFHSIDTRALIIFFFFFINQLIAGPGSFRSESQDQDSSSGAVDRAVSMSVAISLLPRKEKHQPLKRLVWDSLLPWQHEDVAVSEPHIGPL